MSLDISPELESAVRERAAAEGVSVNDLLARTFGRDLQETTPRHDPKAHVQSLLDKWQAADNTPVMAPNPSLPGETPTQALFRKWREEDAHMTDKQKDEEDKLWEDIEKALKENRLTFDRRSLTETPSAAAR